MRLPDRLYGALERVYFAQRAIRREEAQRAVEAEDKALRDYYNDLRQRHAAGKCGGAEAGCCYVPCIPRVA